jgi:Spy/CpxP family protein refolding chaperone
MPEPASSGKNTAHEAAGETATAAQEDAVASRPRTLVKPPSFRAIVQSYSGTNAEWLLTRILGWHDRITPEREKDIDAILYLLEKIGYIPEDPETAAFIALVALVWARLPLAPDLSDNPQHLMTPGAIGAEFRKAAEDMGWITRKEFQQIDAQLDKFMDNIVEPKLEKFQHTLDNMAQKVNDLRNAKGADQFNAREVAGQIAEMLKAGAGAGVDAGKVSESIAEQVIARAGSHFKSVTLGMVAAAFFVGLLAGSWAYSIGFARGGSLVAPPAVSRGAQ